MNLNLGFFLLIDFFTINYKYIKKRSFNNEINNISLDLCWSPGSSNNRNLKLRKNKTIYTIIESTSTNMVKQLKTKNNTLQVYLNLTLTSSITADLQFFN